MFVKRYALSLFLFFHLFSFSQSSFYDVDTIREIRIYFHDNDWDDILDSLYIIGDNERILADILIDGHTYDSVGVRYKGFSSVSVNRVKNPFNIKLDYIIEGQDHEGIDKIKLSNVIQDPSFIREVLSYEISRKYMPSSESNYANLYINDTLWGLYTNVEAVNKDFLIDHFDSKYNPFFKCNPDNLNIQIGGENSNLSMSHGTDTSDYYSYYDIRSDNGWESLYNLIDTLNNFQDSLHHVLNVDRTLWMHALNYSIINFDSYIGYAQNYYLYRDQAGQWNPIIWDLNMSFGGFRLTDASQLYFNGFDISQAQDMDPLVHHHFISVSPRPLMTKLFENARYRRMYIAHIRTIMEENFVNQNYLIRAQYLQNLIDQSVQDDTNKFYTYSDFITNQTSQVPLIASICPGISQLMDARVTYLSSYIGYSGHPIISNISNLPQNFSLGNDIFIRASVTDATYVMLNYRYGENQIFKSVEMLDDGNHNDGIAGDGIYGCRINNCSNSIDYYLYAENDSSGIFSPERAAYEYYNIHSDINPGDIVINELMSNNSNVVVDQSGKYEDWLEIYNTTSYPISTKGVFLSDTLVDLFKWELPNHVILPNDYFIVWADEDGHQGSQHANFKLSNLGEDITLCNGDGSIIDSVSYLPQLVDISYGRSPNGIGPFTMLSPTFDANNDISSLPETYSISSLVYPNPFQDKIFINTSSSYFVTDIYGRMITYGNKSHFINTSEWMPGVYFISLNDQNKSTIKIVKLY